MTTETCAPVGLAALEARLRQDLAWLELPTKRWTPLLQHDGEPVVDVAVVGAGMAGLAAATAIRLLGMSVAVFDRAPEGLEGPWLTYARMNTLRSPKTLTGPALGLPALTFRAWYEAQFGLQAWEALDKIPREQWAHYLNWYRRVMQTPVMNGCTLTDIDGAGDYLALTFATAGGEQVHHARRLVLATGRDGLGGPFIPEFCRALPRVLWAHSADEIDFEALKGRRVGLIGAGASAMDNAGAALEAGAASVDLFIRRPTLPTINKGKGGSGPGSFHGYSSLPDSWKWRYQNYLNRTQTPPPRDSTLRVSRHANARFHFSSPVTSVDPNDGGLRIETPKGEYDLDYLIVATGFRVDIGQRPELAKLTDHIRFWRDRFTVEPGLEDGELSDSPDLTEDFAFQERAPGALPWLTRIHSFNYPSTLSLGKLSGDIPGVTVGAERLARGLAARFFTADPAALIAKLEAYAEPELQGDEWVDADA